MQVVHVCQDCLIFSKDNKDNFCTVELRRCSCLSKLSSLFLLLSAILCAVTVFALPCSKNMRQRYISYVLFYKYATSPRLICFFETKLTHSLVIKQIRLREILFFRVTIINIHPLFPLTRFSEKNGEKWQKKTRKMLYAMV